MAFYNAGNVANLTNSADQTNDINNDEDLSIIPLEKDSFAICELCGRIGRRGQFYPRNNKFCSLRCNASNARRRQSVKWRFRLMEGAEHMAGMIPVEPLPQLQHWQTSYSDLQAGPIKQSPAVTANSYEWKDELFGCDFLAAPVSLFKHAPLHDMWDSTFEGMKVEVKNTDIEDSNEKMSDYFWVATVLKVKGYMGLLRYEGFGSDDSKDFWVNLCCSEVHPVGWCATRGKPLIPPRSIEDKYTDWKRFLVKQLTGARTLPANFYTKLNDSIVSRFSIGSIMEVVDKNRISQVKVATVCEIIGKRLHVKYYDSVPEDNGFWCHEDSPLIHPVGWAFRIGHPLDAPQSYCQRVAAGRLIPSDSTPDMFYKYPSNEPPLFAEGMKLEAIDPLNLSAVCAATVMQILNEGYMMIRIDCYPADASGADWFCYHQRSPCIFPVGFALANNIPLVPPAGITVEEFSWEHYLTLCGGQAADRSLFAARGHVVSHGFVAGMRLECADLMDPRLVCVATVARVVADLLKVHFDGWGIEYDQWLWAHSTDVYPVGWCRAVGHRLEGPLQPPPRPPRKLPTKQPRRRRKQGGTKLAQPPNTNEDSSQNSDMGDTKSLSPPTSVSEVSADLPCPPETDSNPSKMDVDTESKDSTEPSQEMLVDMKPPSPNTLTDISRNTPLTDISQNMLDHTDISQNMLDHTDLSQNMLDHTDISQNMLDHTDLSQNMLDETDLSQNMLDQTDLSQNMLDQTDLSQNMLDHTDISQDSSHNILQLSPVASIEDSDPNKVIPRLVNTSVPLDVLNSVDPENWTTADVARFLTVNDCQPYCVNFANITGPMMLQLTKDEIIEILEMKVGPSLKIFDLIQQLKCKIKQPQCRLLGSFK